MENPSDVMVMDSTSQASSSRSKATSTTSNLMQDMKSGSDKGSATLDESLVISILTFPCHSCQRSLFPLQTSIRFLGYSITGKVGLTLYKSVSIILPLLPTFALIIYNAVELNDMVRKSNTLDKNYVQQVSANSLSILASKLQDERYNAIFDILMSKYVPSKALK